MDLDQVNSKITRIILSVGKLCLDFAHYFIFGNENSHDACLRQQQAFAGA